MAQNLSVNEVDVELSNPQMWIAESWQKINLFMGGTGSGKTFVEGIIAATLINEYPDAFGFIGANTYEQLNTSTLKGIRDVWLKYFNWKNEVDYVVSKQPPSYFDMRNHNFDKYHNIISFKNGAVVYIASLENYLAHEGKEIGWAILDETKDTREEAVKEVILHRLRDKNIPFNPLYIGTSPAKVDWINDWFELDKYEEQITSLIYDKKDYFRYEDNHKSVSICSIYHNEINLPLDYIDGLIREHTNREGKLRESGKRLIFAHPFVKAGGEFYSSWDRARHIGKADFIPNIPVHITYDFNVVPYITLLCWQIQRIGKIQWIRCFDEFCLPSPDNSSEQVSLAFKRRYGEQLKYGLFYYGDPTGKRRDTRGKRNDYQYIQEVLRPYLNNYSERVPRKHPAVVARRDFANNLFDEKFDIRILVGENCKKTIADFEYVKEDVDGTKLKNKVKDSETGQTYEKYGHTSDAFDYFVTELFKELYNKRL